MIVSCINDATITHRKNVKPLYEPKDVIIEGDKGRISQIVSNLLNNAFKFTTDGSISISISTISEEDGKVIVSIKDTGAGIDSELFPRLFSKFATKSFAGTGLGLFIAKNIVEAHGGRIWAENNSDGQGATFSFSLPIRGK
jgi:signal transduction histidine kinase